MNVNHVINRLVRICLLLTALFFFSDQPAGADPVGDFFKRVGQTVSKAFQPQATPAPGKRTAHAPRRTGSRASNVVATPTPGALQEAQQPTQEEKPPPRVLSALAVPAEKAKGDMPYAIPIPGRKGIVTSPYAPEGNYVDVSAFTPGSAVKDPYTGKMFRVP